MSKKGEEEENELFLVLSYSNIESIEFDKMNYSFSNWLLYE